MTSIAPPLYDQLCALEQRWREHDERFGRSPSLAIAVEQTRCFAGHARLLACERALHPSLRVALVREGLWTPRQALDSCLRYSPNQCGHLIDLLEVLPDELIPDVVEHTRGAWWKRFTPLHHPGVWVTKRAGGETLVSRLCARLVEMQRRAEAERLFAEIEHVGARIDALESLQALLAPDELAEALTETLARCRALDPIRRHYALCELSRLYPPTQALALVEEAIAGLPPGHGWCHTPGGLMMMLLAEPVITALDREGLREQLVAWAEREGDVLWANLLDGYAERLAELTGRPFEPYGANDRPPEDPRAWAEAALEQAEQGNPRALLANDEFVPDGLVVRAVELMQTIVENDPAKPWHVLVLLRLAARARGLGEPCGEQGLAVVEQHLTAVAWHRYTYPVPVWEHPEFSLLSAAARRRVLSKELVDARAEASDLDIRREVDMLNYVRNQPPDQGSNDGKWAEQWLTRAREDGPLSNQRWTAARHLWGIAGLDALIAALELVE